MRRLAGIRLQFTLWMLFALLCFEKKNLPLKNYIYSYSLLNAKLEEVCENNLILSVLNWAWNKFLSMKTSFAN